MYTIFKNHFKKEIDLVKNHIKYIPEDIFSKCPEKDPEKIAQLIVEVEVFFEMVKQIQDDFNKNLTWDKSVESKDKKKIKLVNKIKDVPNLFYTHQLTYWNHLSDRGKVLDIRLKHWFLDWSHKSSLCQKLYSYFITINVIDTYYKEEKERRSFIHSVECESICSKLVSVLSLDAFLDIKLFDRDGLDVTMYCESDFQDEKLEFNTCTPVDRYSMYNYKMTAKMKTTNNFIEKEVEKLEKVIKKLEKVVAKNKEKEIKNKSKTSKKKSTKKDAKYLFLLKSKTKEFVINDESIYEIFLNNYKELLKKLKGIDSIKERNKKKIKLTLEELVESAKELDEYNGSDRFLPVLNDMEFINPLNQENEDEVVFDGVTNFAGMVNTGKTTFMLIVANALAKKGLKTALVLRDNEDVFSQVAQLNRGKSISAVPLVGASRKKTHLDKILKLNKNDSSEEIDLSFLNKDIYKHATYTCPLKIFVKSDTNNEDENIFNILKDDEKLMCNNIEIKSIDAQKGEKISCPFVCECDSLKAYEKINSADVYITNTYSFIQTKMNRYYIQNEPRVAKYIYDTCDLVLKDESDAVQFIMDSLFTNSTVLFDKPGFPSIIEKIHEYRTMIQGDTFKYPKERRLLNRIDETREVAEELQEKLTNNRIPLIISKGPMTSRKVFNILAWLLVKEKECLEGIEYSNRTRKKIELENSHNEDFNINEDNYKNLIELFKDIGRFIYEDTKTGYVSTDKDFLVENLDNISKYSSFLSYLDCINKEIRAEIELEKCLNYILKLGYANTETLDLIKSNEFVKRMVLDILGFGIALSKLEGDFVRLMSISSTVKSQLHSISKKDVEDIPAMNPYVKDYNSVLPKCPLGLFFGLVYDYSTESLQMISWENIGRYALYEFDKLWNYFENDMDKGINVGLFSGTSFMPTSPLYHIDILPRYLMRSKNEDKVRIEQEFLPEKYENGKYIYNSGLNKNNEETSNRIYEGFAKSLTRPVFGEKTKLSYYLKEYTKKGRERILISVGNYSDAMKLANYLYELAQIAGDDDLNIGCLVQNKEGLEHLKLPVFNRLTREEIKSISSTDLNVVVVPQTALQRGINMVQEDFLSEYKNGKKVASFSCIIKLNRDYQVPNSHEYAVSRVNHVLMKEIKKMKNKNITPDYNLSTEVNTLFTRLENVYSDYYKTKYFSSLEDEERRMLIGDLCVEDFQFIGRIIRGNSDATVILVDASFFRNLTKEAIVDTKDTSTIVATKWMMDYLKTASENEDENKITEFLINELYGPFLDGIDNMLIKLFK